MIRNLAIVVILAGSFTWSQGGACYIPLQCFNSVVFLKYDMFYSNKIMQTSS